MRTSTLKRLSATVGVTLGMLAFASPAWAGNWTVNTVADDTDADWCADDCTLREAILESNSTTLDDTISFGPNARGEIVLGSALPELPNVEIRGPGAEELTVRRSGAAGTPEFGIFTVGVDRTVKISGLTISGGRSDLGGGIRNRGALTLERNVVSGNSASSAGGGLYDNGSQTTAILSSTFTGNGAGLGGGLYTEGGRTITNSTFSGNDAAGSGGGVYSDGPITITGSTISGNTAELSGGIFGSSSTVLRGTIVAGNSGNRTPNEPGSFVDGGFNLIGALASGAGLKTDPSGNPVLGDNGGPTPTIGLLPNSPAVDKGNAFGSTTDQRGMARPQNVPGVPNAPGGDGSDIGAVEATALSVSDATVTEGDTGTTNAVFTVGLSGPATEPVSVTYATSDGTAASPGDYAETFGGLTFSPGETRKTFAVPVNGDGLDETNETFFVGLTGPLGAGAILSDPDATGTIRDDDPATVLRVSPTGGRVPPAANVTATFSEAMMRSTLNRSTVKLIRRGTKAPVGAKITVGPGGRSVILNPTRALTKGATYTATITTGAKDLAANPLASNKVWSFRVRR